MRVRLLSAVLVGPILAACGGNDADVLAPGNDLAPGQGIAQLADPLAAEPQTQVSPIRRINRDQAPPRPQAGPGQAMPFRSFDGSDNNLQRRDMGTAGSPLRRRLPAFYSDGVAAMAGLNRPNPRAISTAVHSQDSDAANAAEISDYLWQWGQFLDHDIDLTEGADPAEPAPIAIPSGDLFFDPDATGVVQMDFNRSFYDPDTGITTPRQQINEISAWIDASNVYGSSAQRARALRRNDGTGRLRTSAGNLLPFNGEGLANAGGDSAALFLAGDVRANEHAGLAAMHTLFVREHNRQVTRLSQEHPDWDGERLYQQARALVAGLMQHITYAEFLPLLLGPDALPAYQGYDANLDGGISSAFSTAAYRLGHSMLSDHIRRIDANGQPIALGHLDLRDAFFSPSRLIDEGGIAPILRGLASQVCQDIDHLVVDDVRNFLFGPPGAGGFDLAALNIQRGRDHGLPSYNQARRALGLLVAQDFTDISSDSDTQNRLAQVYASPEQVDLWVGGLAEDHLPGARVGPLFHAILRDQFRRLRDADRFWYQRSLSPDDLQRVQATRLSDVIRRNTAIGNELPDDVFRVPR